jgi:hypothetical protein
MIFLASSGIGEARFKRGCSIGCSVAHFGQTAGSRPISKNRAPQDTQVRFSPSSGLAILNL